MTYQINLLVNIIKPCRSFLTCSHLKLIPVYISWQSLNQVLQFSYLICFILKLEIQGNHVIFYLKTGLLIIEKKKPVCLLICWMTFLIAFAKVCLYLHFCCVAESRHLYLRFCVLKHNVRLHASLHLHHSETDKWVLNEQQFPFEAHYHCPLPLCLSLWPAAAHPGHFSTMVSQNPDNQYAMATFLIMQFILSTGCLHPNFLACPLILLYFSNHFLSVSPISFL